MVFEPMVCCSPSRDCQRTNLQLGAIVPGASGRLPPRSPRGYQVNSPWWFDEINMNEEVSIALTF